MCAVLISMWIVRRLLPQALAQFLLARVGCPALRVFLPHGRSTSPDRGRSTNQHGDAQRIEGLETEFAMTAIMRSLILQLFSASQF
jgi:hypothetical protein